MFKDYLKLALKEKGKSQKELAEFVHVQPNTVSDWLNKGNSPKIEHLCRISQYLNISIDWLLTGSTYIQGDLTANEIELLDNYRRVNSHFQHRILERTETFVEIQKGTVPNIPLYTVKTDTYASKKSPLVSELETQTNIKVFDLPASAGLGNYLEGDSPYEMLHFNKSTIPYGTDFGIRISGDSMEPQIKDGSIVWVKEVNEVSNGNVGIFILDGEAYCKKLNIDYDKREVCLISLNKKYSPIIIKEHSDLRTIGKVLL